MALESAPGREVGSGDAAATPNGGLLDDFLSAPQLASELGVSPRTVQRWHRLREAPPVTRIGRRVYYHRSAVEQWLRSREQPVEVA